MLSLTRFRERCMWDFCGMCYLVVTDIPFCTISLLFLPCFCVFGRFDGEYISIYPSFSISFDDSQHSFRILVTKMDGMKMGRRRRKGKGIHFYRIGIKVLCVRRRGSRFSICLSACYRGLAYL